MTALHNVVRKERQESRKKKQARFAPIAAPRKEVTQAKPVRVNGPYPENGKWRIYLIDESGRKSFIDESRQEAEAMRSKFASHALALTERTVGESLDEYRDYRLKTRGVLQKTADDHCRHLRTLLPLDCPIASLTPERAQRLYLEYTARPNRYTGKPISVATHQWVLLIAKCWGRWLVKSGTVPVSPFAEVEPIGKPSAGKKQLTRDEAQRLSQVAIARADHGDVSALGVLLMLHLGLRQGEVGARVARDVDNDSQVLIIPFGKNASTRRRLKVPTWLQPYLHCLITDKAPTELLFSADGKKERPKQFWWCQVHRLCKAASVSLVCPHSLRGLHATLAIEEGTSGEAVARALGHTSFEMTAKHYASADSVANARVAKATRNLTPDTDRVGRIFSQLTPEELAELRQRLLA